MAVEYNNGEVIIRGTVASDSVIALGNFETGVVSLPRRKWFTENDQTITVTGQIRGRQGYYQRFTSKYPPLEHTLTHIHTHRIIPISPLMESGDCGLLFVDGVRFTAADSFTPGLLAFCLSATNPNTRSMKIKNNISIDAACLLPL